MQSSTWHEIIVELAVLFLGLAITKGHGWFTSLVHRWDNNRAIESLRKMEEDPILYAEKRVRQQRMWFGIGGYLAGFNLFLSQIELQGMDPLKALLGLSAGIRALVGGSSSSTSTETGVKEVRKRLRKRLDREGSFLLIHLDMLPGRRQELGTPNRMDARADRA